MIDKILFHGQGKVLDRSALMLRCHFAIIVLKARPCTDREFFVSAECFSFILREALVLLEERYVRT